MIKKGAHSGCRGTWRPDTINLMPYLSKLRTAISSEDFHSSQAMADKGRHGGDDPPKWRCLEMLNHSSGHGNRRESRSETSSSGTWGDGASCALPLKPQSGKAPALQVISSP